MGTNESETAVPMAQRVATSPLTNSAAVVRWLRPYLLLPVAAAALSVAVSFAISPSYTASARILPPQQQGGAAALIASQLGSLAGLAGAAAGIKNPADQFVALLKTTTIADRIIGRFNLRELYQEQFVEDVRKQLEKNSSISSGAKDGIITIEVDDHDPARAADMANAYVEELQKLTSTLAVTEAAQRRVFFDTQLRDVSRRLATAEASLREGGVNASIMNSEPRAVVEMVARLRAAVAASEVKVATLRGFMAGANPDYQLAMQELNELRGQLARAERGSQKTAGLRSDGGEDYVARYRDFKYQEALFELMAKQLELARLDEGREGSMIQVIDSAKAPEKKSWPRRGAIAVVTWLTVLALMIIVAVVRSSLAGRDGIASD